MTYRFKWEQLRHLREQQRQQAQYQYASILHKLKEAEAKLDETMTQLKRAELRFRSTVDEIPSVRQMQELDQYIHHTREMARQHRDLRDRLNQQVQATQNRLRERRVSEEIMNKLKEKDYARFCLEELRADQRLMDEIAVMRHGRRHSRRGVI